MEILETGILLTIFYFLFLKGYFLRFIMWGCGFLYLCEFIAKHLQISNHVFMTILGQDFSWAIIFAGIITMLTILTSRGK